MPSPRMEYLEFRDRMPLTLGELEVARENREIAIEDANAGSVIDIQALAALLGQQMATPVRATCSGKLHPVAYRTGSVAILTEIATGFGLDPEPFIALMDRSRSEEVAMVGTP